MFSLARPLALALVLAFGALGACSMDHTPGADADVPDTNHHEGHDGGSVVHLCGGELIAGAACDFLMPCTRVSDFWMGRCGSETWTCVDGHIVYSDMRFPCAMDAGVTPEWCDGYVAPPAATTDECRADSDCGSLGGTCWAPGDTSGLHGGGACPMMCATDPDCADGDVCERFNGGFCSQCIRACTETSCGAWEACGDDGHCHPARCERDGYVCAPGSHCAEPGDAVFDVHGCTIAPCSSDADCGCGACVEGACALGPGRCDLPRP